jgi:membrane glycosyltransferase
MVSSYAARLTTPAGLQPSTLLQNRRRLMLFLNTSTYFAFLLALASVLDRGGWTLIDCVFFLSAALALPWSVLGFWNAVIGFWLLHGVRDGMKRVAPFAVAGDTQTTLTVRTAVLMTLRNEDPARALSRLAILQNSIDSTGQGAAFCYFVLSDTTDPTAARMEEAMFSVWRNATPHSDRLFYRRREANTGYKAGNIAEFCLRWGQEFTFMLPLDADSLMSGETVVRMARIMQAHPRLGILQSLVVGAPATSAFARLFQFGMRHGMRPYTMGHAWWTADCGPFWGHNAFVRIKPFVDHCKLPVLSGKPPFGGHILSHDQVEATLMRKAGYEVRVLPEECGSWEDNPPTVVEFTRRDQRWCQGNLQYVKLLDLPGLHLISRFQLVWAIAMFIGIPAWTVMLVLSALKGFETADLAAGFSSQSAIRLYCIYLMMFTAPKLAGFLDIALTPGGLRRYGGALRFTVGALAELIFSFLLGAITTFRTGLFMAGLAIGRTISWDGQARDAHALSWTMASRALWPQTLFGVGLMALMAYQSVALLLWSLPLTLGFVLAIPFTVFTASPGLARFLVKHRLCAIPEELDVPREIAALSASKGDERPIAA